MKGNEMETKLSTICVYFAFCIGLVLSPGCKKEQTEVLPDPGAPKKASEFTLKNYDGTEVSLADNEGKIVVLEWFSYDCPFSKRHHETGTMKGLAEKFADKGVVWLGINSTDNQTDEGNRGYAEKYDTKYPILNDQDGMVGKMYGAETTPHMFIIDKNGYVVYNGAIDSSPKGGGENVTNYVETALNELIAGQTVSTPRTKSYGCSVKYAD